MLHCPLQRWRGVSAGEPVDAGRGWVVLFVAGVGHGPGTQNTRAERHWRHRKRRLRGTFSSGACTSGHFTGGTAGDWVKMFREHTTLVAAQLSNLLTVAHAVTYYSLTHSLTGSSAPDSRCFQVGRGGAAHKRTADSPGSHPAGDLCLHNFCSILCKV